MDNPIGLRGDKAIVQRAKDRFKRCQQWEALFIERFEQDLRFADGDPDNNYQWLDNIRDQRELQDKPCLTINKVRQHNLQIINDAKQNKPGVKISPTGGGATYQSAKAYMGVVRYIEYRSAAEQVYDTATEFQVKGGIGYWRVITEYADNESFDLEIKLRRVKDPRRVRLDPDINELDGSDARYGFVFEDLPNDEFKDQYSQFKDRMPPVNPLDLSGWVTAEHTRVCEYYEKSQKEDTLYLIKDDKSGEEKAVRRSTMGPGLARLINDEDPKVRKRKILDDQVMWYKIAGDEIIEKTEWPGKYIPIVRIVGEEVIFDGQVDRKGHTRAMKDAQRMYNYWTSKATEDVALQTNNPFIGPMEAFNNYEDLWRDANRVNHAFLPYNHLDEQGNTIPAPTRTQSPQMASAYVQGMSIAQNELMMSSGQYQSQFGQNENATSGKAINERQRQGDNATYHFIDGLSIGIRFTGKILIDLIPKVYDVPRVVMMMAEDGTPTQIQLNPDAKEAYTETQEEEEGAKAIFNPNVGKYEVQADVGPSYATRRQEAWNAFTQITAQNKELTGLIGDLMFRNADFPGADEIAERLARLVPPEAKGDAPPPQFAKAMAEAAQQNKQLQDLLADALEKLAKANKKLDDQQVDLEVKRADAESRRITALSNAQPELGPDVIKAAVQQVILEMLGGSIGGRNGSGSPVAAPPMQGAAVMPPLSPEPAGEAPVDPERAMGGLPQ